MTRCEKCIFGIPAPHRTADEERQQRNLRAQREGVDRDDPLPERPGTCHKLPPRAEMIPTPQGPMNISLWPSVVFSDPQACCGEGQPKIELN